MTISFKELIKKLPKKQRNKIRQRTKELENEIRKAEKLNKFEK